MGLDVGSKTVGIALSDPLGWTAQALETIKINENKKEFGLDQVCALVEAYEVSKVVVGLPKNMDGSIGDRAQASLNYGRMLEEACGVAVTYQDERLTTMQVNRMMIEEGDLSRKKRKQLVDKLAAQAILQTYMDRQKWGCLCRVTMTMTT